MTGMSDSTEVPPVPPVPPVEPVSVAPPPPPVVLEPARPDPYAQQNPYAPGYGANYGANYAGAPAYAAQPYAPATTNTLSIVALILAFFVPLAAIICGHIALAQIKRTGQGGHGLALAGTILGYSFVALGVVIALIYAAVIIAAISSSTYSSVG